MTSALPTLRWSDCFGRVDQVTVSRHLLTGNHGAHDHDFMELAVVLKGAAIHVCSDEEVPIGKGFAVLLRPGTWHAYRGCADLDVVNFCFPPSMARAELRPVLDERVRSLLRSGEGLQVTRLSESVTDSLERLERVERRAMGALGLMIWTLDQFASTVPPRSSLHPAVEKAVCELEEQPNNPWTAKRLAQVIGLDKAYLSRLFKTHVGVGPMAYLAMLRAEQAASLLRTSDLNCGEVGYAVGYSDPNLFSRRFRARFGVSPSAYRGRARGNARP